jgi:uncharacterized protein
MQELERFLKNFGRVGVAFSSGIDSTLLAWYANKVLGSDAFIYTVEAPYTPGNEVEEARTLAKKYDFRHRVLTLAIPEDIRNNPPNRCYLCKKQIFTTILNQARNDKVEVLFDGSNTDDKGDYRPGLKALKELEVRSPFMELGIDKTTIRQEAKAVGLPNWDKPANACLLTRLPYDTPLTENAIQQVEQAEKILHEQGFQAVRVRHHGTIARIELPGSEIQPFVEAGIAEEVSRAIKNLGFVYVSLELTGYTTGSLNATLK